MSQIKLSYYALRKGSWDKDCTDSMYWYLTIEYPNVLHKGKWLQYLATEKFKAPLMDLNSNSYYPQLCALPVAMTPLCLLVLKVLVFSFAYHSKMLLVANLACKKFIENNKIDVYCCCQKLTKRLSPLSIFNVPG